jgi:hypothetical protein
MDSNFLVNVQPSIKKQKDASVFGSTERFPEILTYFVTENYTIRITMCDLDKKTGTFQFEYKKAKE